MNERTIQLLERTFRFGVETLEFLNSLPYNFVYKIPIIQLARSSVSIGSNYEEAQGASTKRDFLYKISISQREARESAYWLRILNELYKEEKLKGQFIIFKNEANELKNIFAQIRISGSK